MSNLKSRKHVSAGCPLGLEKWREKNGAFFDFFIPHVIPQYNLQANAQAEAAKGVPQIIKIKWRSYIFRSKAISDDIRFRIKKTY